MAKTMIDMRRWVLWGCLALILITINTLILGKEAILSQGETILLRLAPRDPRSLLQGDYMVLRYAVAEAARRDLNATESTTGNLVVLLDESGVAHYVRLHEQDTPLADNERLLYFRKRGNLVKLASDAFFFQEEHEPLYRNAQYGELKITSDGEALLVRLRGPDHERLGPDEKVGVQQ